MTPIRKKMLNAISTNRRKLSWINFGKGINPNKLLRAWLRRTNENKAMHCPWKKWDYPHEICQAMFPRIINDSGGIKGCPCTMYSLKYVIKRAKEALK